MTTVLCSAEGSALLLKPIVISKTAQDKVADSTLAANSE